MFYTKFTGGLLGGEETSDCSTGYSSEQELGDFSSEGIGQCFFVQIVVILWSLYIRFR